MGIPLPEIQKLKLKPPVSGANGTTSGVSIAELYLENPAEIKESARRLELSVPKALEKEASVTVMEASISATIGKSFDDLQASVDNFYSDTN